MKAISIRQILSMVAVIFIFGTANASSFCSMSSEELLAFLPASGKTDIKCPAVTAKGAVGVNVQNPVKVTAQDMMTMVYGVVDSKRTREECIAESASRLGVSPEQEEDGCVWMDSGYGVDYHGMRPEVAALARFEGENATDRLSDYCFFFLFPYEAHREQCEFSTSLLTDFQKLGAEPGVNVNSDDLYNVIGVYDGNLVDIRLIDDIEVGRYVLVLSVEPEAFTPEDDLAAL